MPRMRATSGAGAGFETLDHADLANMPDGGGTNSDHDVRYVNITGDTMTGDLDMGANKIKNTNASESLNMYGTDGFMFEFSEGNLGYWAAGGFVSYMKIIPGYNESVDLGTSTAKWQDLFLSRNLTDGTNTLTVANAKTAYDHSQDNTQAHTDYMLNTGDTTTGNYDFTAGDLTTTGDITASLLYATNIGIGNGIVGSTSGDLTLSSAGNIVTANDIISTGDVTAVEIKGNFVLVKDALSAYYMSFAVLGALTANRGLTFGVGNASRLITLTGDTTLNQDVSTAGSPSFAAVTADLITTDINEATVQNVNFFEDATVGNTTDGPDIVVWRNAAEGNNFIRMGISQYEGARIDTDAPRLDLKIGDSLIIRLSTSMVYYYDPIALHSDNRYITFGTGYDARIYYDGNDLVLSPQNVGTGGVRILSMKSGATQAAAGAAADELWKTNGHTSLPDNVVMLGVGF